MLIDQIKTDLISSQKSRDKVKVSTLRFFLSELNNFVCAKYPPAKGGVPVGGLPDEDVITILQKLIKTHKESIEAFKVGKRPDLVEKEEAELVILQKYV